MTYRQPTGFIDFASKLPASFVSGANIDTDVMTGHVVFWVSVFLAAVTNSPSRRSVSVYSAMVAALFLAPTLFEQNEILYVPLAIIGTPLVLII